jgi:phosphonate transport system permease protein
MPVIETQGTKVWQRRTRNESLFVWAIWLIGTAIFLYAWQQISNATT